MGMDDKENEKERPFRMDFIQEVVKSEKQENGSTVLMMKMIPNPKRYDAIEMLFVHDTLSLRSTTSHISLPLGEIDWLWMEGY